MIGTVIIATILASALLSVILFAQPVQAQTSSTKLCKYALWCGRVDYSKNPTLFMSRLQTGQFDAIVVTAARWTTSNTLDYSASDLSYFLTQVKNAFPKIAIYADICGYVYGPNLTTETLRQKCVSAVKTFWNQYSDKLTGIVDDTEKWTGTTANQYAYFGSCASVMKSLGVPYYPWLYYKYLPYIASDKCAVGLYGGHSYYETEWKTAIDKVQSSTTQSYTKSGYQIWLMADHYSNYPTVKQQLEFLDEQLSLHGAAYYSKMEMIGIWTYDQMTTEDWTAWTTWVNNHSTTNTSGSTSNSSATNNSNTTTNNSTSTSTSTTTNLINPSALYFGKTSKITATGSKTTSYYRIDVTYNSLGTGESAWWRQSITTPVAGKTYTLSVEYCSNMKTNLILMAYVGSTQAKVASVRFDASSTWTKVQISLTVPSDTTVLYADLRLFNIATGWAQFRNAQLTVA